MSNCAIPTCTVKTSRIGPWFLLAPLDVKIPRGLPRSDHAKFSYDQAFAGLSPRGIPLSVKGSTNQAEIGPVPLVPDKPGGWLELPHFANAGLPVTTATPRLAFFGIRDAGWGEKCTALCIHPNDIAPIVEITGTKALPQRTDLKINKLGSDLANLLAKYPQQLKVILFEAHTCVRVPPTLRLDRTEWAVLKRHVFTAKSSGTILDTAWIGDGWTCFKIPGHDLLEVQAAWGVSECKPWGYDGKSLYFTSFNVLNATKLSRLFPQAKNLEGRRLSYARFNSCGRYLYLAVALDEAEAAGIIPGSGVLQVDPGIRTIYFRHEDLRVDTFKRPIVAPASYWQHATIVCPAGLVGQFLVPVRRAIRSHVIPDTLPSFRVRTKSVTRPSDADPTGKFYLLTDLKDLVARDLKQESIERRAREKYLVDRYGSALPKGYEKLTDKQIALYVKIRELVQIGEIIETENHPLLPSGHLGWYMVQWLRKEAPNLVMTCPVTNKYYVFKLDGFDDLVDIPGFWRAVESTFGAGAWLRKLITSPKAQVAALIDTI